MKLCGGDKCPHYWAATKYPRKCFYEAQCWRGRLAILWALVKLKVR